jgi:NAD+ diphosphatase
MQTEMGYIRNALERSNVERETATVAELAADPSALRLVFAGDVPVLRVEGEALSALLPADAAALPAPTEQVFLGRLDKRPVIAMQIGEAPDLFRDESRFRLIDLRSIAVQGAVPLEQQGMLAQARSLLLWHGNHRFCSKCGAPTVPAVSGLRRDCTACGGLHFPRTDPVAIMLVSQGDHCLLGRQRHFVPGMYSALAGFISPGETLEDAVRREVLEEAGIRVGAVRYVASQPWPFASSLMIGCLGEALGENLTVDHEELEDARWFSRDEVRRMLARTHPDGLSAPVPMAIAHHLLRKFAEGGEAPA